jgi:hypothetical protein
MLGYRVDDSVPRRLITIRRVGPVGASICRATLKVSCQFGSPRRLARGFVLIPSVHPLTCVIAALSDCKKTMAVFVQRHTGQFPGRKRASVDIDAVMQHFRLHDRRMAMHDDFAEISIAVEKLAPNP